MNDRMWQRGLLAAVAAMFALGLGVAAAQQGSGPMMGNGTGTGNGQGGGMMGNGAGQGTGMMGNGQGGGMMGNGAGTGMMGGGGGMMGGGWTTSSYLDSLKQRLAITPKQEPAWKDYAETVSGIGEQMQALHQTMFESMGTASWQERRDMMNTMFDARQQAFQTVHDAATKLLPSLTPAQRAQAQGILPGLGTPRGMMGTN